MYDYWNKIRQTRQDGLFDACEYYLYMFEKKGCLSKAQKQDLKEKADMLSCFGEEANKYVEECCYPILNK